MSSQSAVTNQEFAEAVGCSQSMASRLLNGFRLPGQDATVRISEAYGIPLEDLAAARKEGEAAMGRLLRERTAASPAASN